MTRHFLRRLLTLWLTLALLASPLLPLRAADISSAGHMTGSGFSMSSMPGSSAEMNTVIPCEVCDTASTSRACGEVACAQGSCSHGGCFVCLLPPTLACIESCQTSRTQAVTSATYRSHKPELPKRPPIL